MTRVNASEGRSGPHLRSPPVDRHALAEESLGRDQVALPRGIDEVVDEPPPGAQLPAHRGTGDGSAGGPRRESSQ